MEFYQRSEWSDVPFEKWSIQCPNDRERLRNVELFCLNVHKGSSFVWWAFF